MVLQLMLIGFVLDRCSDLLSKLNFVARMYYASWHDKKQRIAKMKCILLLSALLSPLVAAIIMLSVVLAAPLLPLFQLPIFFVGFPRPKRFWPDPGVGASPSPDSVRCLVYGALFCRIGLHSRMLLVPTSAEVEASMSVVQ
jgi:hypothetical protein